MASAKRVVVAGAAGVFGSLLVDELRKRKEFDVIATTRRQLDVRDPSAVRRLAAGAFAFCCAAGPFQQLDDRIVGAVVEAGAHWLDIGDDAWWFFRLVDDADLDRAARARNVAVVPGLSTMPAMSTALARQLLGNGAPAGTRCSITLRVGNRNRKGVAVIASALGARGGRINTPDRELLRRSHGASVDTRLELESAVAGVLMRAAARLPLGGAARVRVARILAFLARPWSRFGSSGGEIRVEASGAIRSLAVTQRAAILPLVLALERLAREPLAGCLTPAEVVADDDLLAALADVRDASSGS